MPSLIGRNVGFKFSTMQQVSTCQRDCLAWLGCRLQKLHTTLAAQQKYNYIYGWDVSMLLGNSISYTCWEDEQENIKPLRASSQIWCAWTKRVSHKILYTEENKTPLTQVRMRYKNMHVMKCYIRTMLNVTIRTIRTGVVERKQEGCCTCRWNEQRAPSGNVPIPHWYMRYKQQKKQFTVAHVYTAQFVTSHFLCLLPQVTQPLSKQYSVTMGSCNYVNDGSKF